MLTVIIIFVLVVAVMLFMRQPQLEKLLQAPVLKELKIRPITVMANFKTLAIPLI